MHHCRHFIYACAFKWLLTAVVVCGVPLHVQGSAQTQAGLLWLTALANADGSYSTQDDAATPMQTTAEVLHTFQLLGHALQTDPAAAREFLGGQAFHNTEYLARKIIASSEIASDVSQLDADLQTHQNPDGGFGEMPGFQSTALDTAFALEALAVADQGDSSAVNAIGFLLKEQRADGGFPPSDTSESSVYTTALAAGALHDFLFQFAVGSARDRAVAYLLAQQLPEGGWATPWLSASALLAIVPASSDTSAYANALTRLAAAQSADGSWQGDAYATALALQALHAAAKPDSIGTEQPGTTDPGESGSPADLGIIAGLVSDATTGEPIAGARVSVSGASTAQATSALDGSFRILSESGPVTVSAHAVGYETLSGTGTVLAGGTLSFSPALYPANTAPTDTAADITVRVIADDTGEPLATAVIEILETGITGTADASGQIALSDIGPGQLDILFSAAGYQALRYSALLPPAGLVNLGTVRLPRETRPDSATLIGTVIDAQSGDPIPGASVVVEQTGQAAVTNTEGEYRISDIAELDLTLFVQATGYISALQPVNLPGPGVTHWHIGLQRVTAGGVQIEALASNQPRYEAYTPAIIRIELGNYGDTAQRVLLVLKIVDGGDRVAQRTVLGMEQAGPGGAPGPETILPNETRAFRIDWFTGAEPPGAYQILAQAYDPASHQLLSERLLPIEIVATQRIARLSVHPSPPYTSIGQEQRVAFIATLANRSNVVTNLELGLQLIAPDGRVVRIHQSPLSLRPDEYNKSFRLAGFSHRFEQSGQYRLDVDLVAGPIPEEQDVTGLTVAPAIRIDASQDLTPATVAPGADQRLRIHIQLKGTQQP